VGKGGGRESKGDVTKERERLGGDEGGRRGEEEGGGASIGRVRG